MACPGCGSRLVLRSSNVLKHLVRLASGSGRRACLSCGLKWREDRPRSARWSRAAVPVLIGVLGGIVAAALAGVSLNPVDWFKSAVVSAYHEDHGKGATKALWGTLGGFYGSKSEAIADFRDH